MGQSELKTQLFNMLKFAFVVCCAALAAAEPEAKADADPALLYGAYGAYGAYGYGLPYAGYGYGAYPYAYYGKRSADAEPKAEAVAYYYGGLRSWLWLCWSWLCWIWLCCP